ncbi:MAG: hypothetical protein GY844_14770 [Bradyrhizobium sp.]|nr:hypothetical protein [Bradyrhizobium sp.]
MPRLDARPTNDAADVGDVRMRSRKYRLALLAFGAGCGGYVGALLLATWCLHRGLVPSAIWQQVVTTVGWSWYANVLTVLGMYGATNVAGQMINGK